MKAEGLRPAQRVRKRRDFERAYQQGCKVVTPHFALYVRANGNRVSRLGVTATRRLGNATVRNRARRLVREAYRKRQRSLPAGYDFVVVARHRLLELRSTELEPLFLEAAQRAVRQMEK